MRRFFCIKKLLITKIMETINRLIGLGTLIGLIVLTAMLITQKSFGSVNDSSMAYNSTTTRNATLAGSSIASPLTLSTVGGTFGSVVITGASAAGAGFMYFYDGTTTSNGALYGTTTIMAIPPGAAAGTYTCDCSYSRGLVMEITGLAATSTITWKK